MSLIRNVTVETFTVNVNVPSATETVVVLSDPLALPSGQIEVVVLGWCQLTTAATTTSITPRIRRGTDATGTLVGEANTEALKAAAGQTEPFTILVREVLAGGISPTYVFTLTSAGAGACTALQGAIAVLAVR